MAKRPIIKPADGPGKYVVATHRAVWDRYAVRRDEGEVIDLIPDTVEGLLEAGLIRNA